MADKRNNCRLRGNQACLEAGDTRDGAVDPRQPPRNLRQRCPYPDQPVSERSFLVRRSANRESVRLVGQSDSHGRAQGTEAIGLVDRLPL